MNHYEIIRSEGHSNSLNVYFKESSFFTSFSSSGNDAHDGNDSGKGAEDEYSKGKLHFTISINQIQVKASQYYPPQTVTHSERHFQVLSTPDIHPWIVASYFLKVCFFYRE